MWATSCTRRSSTLATWGSTEPPEDLSCGPTAGLRLRGICMAGRVGCGYQLAGHLVEARRLAQADKDRKLDQRDASLHQRCFQEDVGEGHRREHGGLLRQRAQLAGVWFEHVARVLSLLDSSTSCCGRVLHHQRAPDAGHQGDGSAAGLPRQPVELRGATMMKSIAWYSFFVVGGGREQF